MAPQQATDRGLADSVKTYHGCQVTEYDDTYNPFPRTGLPSGLSSVPSRREENLLQTNVRLFIRLNYRSIDWIRMEAVCGTL